MSEIEQKWIDKGYRVLFQKSDVKLISPENSIITIPKEYRIDDFGYEWELTELWNQTFKDEQIKQRASFRDN